MSGQAHAIARASVFRSNTINSSPPKRANETCRSMSFVGSSVRSRVLSPRCVGPASPIAWAEGVVDAFETVQIQIQNSDGSPASRASLKHGIGHFRCERWRWKSGQDVQYAAVRCVPRPRCAHFRILAHDHNIAASRRVKTGLIRVSSAVGIGPPGIRASVVSHSAAVWPIDYSDRQDSRRCQLRCRGPR